MATSLEDLLAKLKVPLDKARAFGDGLDKAIVTLDEGFLGHLIALIPGAGNAVTIVVQAAQILDEVLDAVDSIVDASAPTPVPPPAAGPAKAG
jgi:hypothetical protein